MGEKIVLERERLQKVRDQYFANELRGKELMKKSQDQNDAPEIVKMYELSIAKAAGMKEAIDGIFWSVDKEFPIDEGPQTLDEIIKESGGDLSGIW